MTIEVECQCGKVYKTGEENAGRRFACKQCGAEVVVPEGGEGDIAATLAWIREQRDAGHSRGALRQQLEEHGYDAETAASLVDTALGDARQTAARRARSSRRAAHGGGGGDSEGLGWLIWIGLLLFINLLSWIFDWPFWIY